jgi:hypothetical protein
MKMSAYLILMLFTFVASFLAIRLYRAFSGIRSVGFKRVSLSEKSMVSLSEGSGQWSVGRQQGFVSTEKHVSSRRANVKKKADRVSAAGKGSVKKPWGW